ncbi:MAG TPA: tetratricopeptide repeat protein [Terriglobales bacterium]|jgi:tetratricopeptide (TPR) repeat protein|nr:tetratricopeptide repeat protein [Terriglobales bacterium]
MKSKSIIIALLLALCLGALPLWAQLGNMAIVSGKVTSADGKPLAGADVQLTSRDIGRKNTGKTDKRGEYQIAGVTSGAYDILVTLNGATVYSAQNLQVTGQSEAAQCYVQNGMCTYNIDLAKEAKAAAAKISPEEQKRREELEKENAKIGDLNAQFKVAQEAEKAGDFDRAISILQGTTQASPNSEVPWGNLAQAYLMAKRYPEAADALKKAIAIKPDKAPFHMGLGDAYAGAGKPDDAATEYSAAAQMDPTQAAMAYFKIGATWTNASTRASDDATRKKDLAAANDAFDKAIAAKPDFADAYYQKAQNLVGQASYTKDGKIQPVPGTVEAYQKYLELEPTGKYAQTCKDMIGFLGGQVQTQFKKGKGK